jgi:hypothetical protein
MQVGGGLGVAPRSVGCPECCLPMARQMCEMDSDPERINALFLQLGKREYETLTFPDFVRLAMMSFDGAAAPASAGPSGRRTSAKNKDNPALSLELRLQSVLRKRCAPPPPPPLGPRAP